MFEFFSVKFVVSHTQLKGLKIAQAFYKSLAIIIRESDKASYQNQSYKTMIDYTYGCESDELGDLLYR